MPNSLNRVLTGWGVLGVGEQKRLGVTFSEHLLSIRLMSEYRTLGD